MAIQKQDGLHTDCAESAEDLTGKEFHFATYSSADKLSLCGDGGSIAGVISEGKATGYHTSVNTKGNPILKVVAGSAIAFGDSVQSDADGKAKTGTTNAFGTARNAAAAGEMVMINTFET